MDLKTADYEVAASSTTPPIVHTTAVRAAVIFHLLSEFAKAGSNLDKYLKKPLVYGPTRVTEEHVAQFAGLADIDEPLGEYALTDEQAMFAHGVVGVATEAGELVEALMDVWFFKKPWDRTNVLEEGGDVLWYVVRFLKAAGYTLPEAMERNILKLTNRHHRDGKTFNPEADRNRDTAAERALLEAPPGVRAIVEAAAAQEPYLGLATNAELTAELEARKSLGHTAPGYRTTDGGPTAERRGLALLVTRGDQGQEEIWLDSYAGGGAPGGEWSTLTTVLYLGPNPGEEAIRRTYIATDLLAPDGVKITVGGVEVSASTPEHMARMGFELAEKTTNANLDDPAMVFYPIHGNPMTINGHGGPMRDATDEEMKTLPVDPATYVTGDPGRVSMKFPENIQRPLPGSFEAVHGRKKHQDFAPKPGETTTENLGDGVVLERRGVDRPASPAEIADAFGNGPIHGTD